MLLPCISMIAFPKIGNACRLNPKRAPPLNMAATYDDISCCQLVDFAFDGLQHLFLVLSPLGTMKFMIPNLMREQCLKIKHVIKLESSCMCVCHG